MVNSSEYMHVTYAQISDMKHAIGFENGKITGRIHRKYIPYRNFFTAPGEVLGWEDLCRLGFAVRRSLERYRGVCYSVTPDGFLFLERVTGVQIVPESN